LPKPVQGRRRFFSGGMFFPDVRKLLLEHKGWEVAAGWHMQALAPRDPKLGEKLGIKPKSKVAVLAGYYGNWARSLARFCDVRYTDISSSMASYMKKHRGKVQSVSRRPAETVVRRPKVYDWSFLFEPFAVEGIRLVFLHSLLNTKGCKIAGTEALMKGAYSLDIDVIDKYYGTKSAVRKVNIRAISWPGGSPKNYKVDLITIRTNAKARKKAMLDLKLLHKLNMAVKQGKKLRTENLCKELHVSRETLEESRQRLSMIALGIGKAAVEQYRYLE